MKSSLLLCLSLITYNAVGQNNINTFDNRGQLIQQNKDVTTQTWDIDNNQNFTSQKITNSSVTIDLQNTVVSVSSITIVAGNTITVNTSIYNSGGGTANSSLFKYFLSSNTALDAGDVQLDSTGINGLTGGNTYNLGNKQLTIPSNTTNGMYYILFVADALNQVTESNENNNVAYQQIIVASCTNAITINAVPTPANCGVNNGIITLNPSGGTSPYQYSIDGGVIYSSQNAFNNLAPTTYAVKVKDLTGCTATQNVTIINAGNVTPIAAFTPTVNANAVSVQNTSTNATAYLWNFGDGNTLNTLHGTHIYSAQGTYNICLTAGNACASIQNCQQVSVTSSISGSTSNIFAKIFKNNGKEILLNDVCQSQTDSGFYIGGNYDGDYPVYGQITKNGEMLWSKELNATAFYGLSIMQIEPFGSGYLIQVGDKNLVMIDKDGIVQWTRVLNNYGLIKIFPQATLVCGLGANTNTLVIQKINQNGGLDWSKQYQYQIYGTSTNDSTDLVAEGDITQIGTSYYALALTVRKKYISTSSSSYYSYYDPLLLKIDASGNHQWSKTAGGTLDNYDAPKQIYYDALVNKLFVINESAYQSSYAGLITSHSASNGTSSFCRLYTSGTPYYLGNVNTLNGYNFKWALGNLLFSVDNYLYPASNNAVLVDTQSADVYFNDCFVTKEKGYIGYFTTINNNTNASGLHRGVLKIDSFINSLPCKSVKNVATPANITAYMYSTQIYTPNVSNFSPVITSPNFIANAINMYDSLLCEQKANLCSLATDLTATKQTPCIGEQIVVTRAPQYGTSQWFLNDTLKCTNCGSYSYIFNQPGTYKIKMKIANFYCVDSSELTYSIAPQITASSTTTPTICGGSTGQISILVNGGLPPYQYAIDTVNTYLSSNIFSSLDSGHYVIKIIDDYGCVKTISDTIHRAMSNMSLQVRTTHPSCNGYADGEISVLSDGGTAPYSYSWSNSATTNSITGLSQNSYTVIVTDANSCLASQTIALNNPPKLELDSLIATDDICLDSVGTALAIATGGTPPYAYAWSNGGVDSFQHNLWPGDYIISVFDNNGCMIRDTVTVDTASAPSPAPLITPALTHLCQGNGVTLQSSYAGGSHQWYNNGVLIPNGLSDSYYTTTGDTFTVAYTNIDGCTSISQPSIVIVHPLPPVPTVSFSNDTLYSSVQDTGYNYQWYLYGINNPIAAATNYYHKATEIGAYFVVITDSNGCQSSSQFFGVPVLGVEQIFTSHSFTSDTIIVYPNPTTGNVMIATHTFDDAPIDVAITDILGKKLASYTIIPKNKYGYMKINIAGHASGVYMFTFSRGGSHWQSIRAIKK